MKDSIFTNSNIIITRNKFLLTFLACVFVAFPALLTNFSIFTSCEKVIASLVFCFFGGGRRGVRRLVGSGVGRAGGVHLAFESSDWLFGYRKLWLHSLLANSNLSDIVLSTASLIWLVLLQVHKDICYEHKKNHLNTNWKLPLA